MNNNYVPNTSSIPNIIFDYWMCRLKPAEFKVLLCICRKTYGFHKNFDLISIKQIEKMTGLSRQGIFTAVEVLVEYDLVIKVKSKTSDGDDAPNRYEINVNCSHLEDVNSIGGGSKVSGLGVVNSVDQGVVNSVDPQKKTYTKENIQNIHTSLTVPEEPRVCSKKSKPKISEEAKSLYPIFIKAIKDFKPSYAVNKNTEPVLKSLDEMLHEDKRAPEDILRVLRWGLNDNLVRDKWDGWSSKILCKNPAAYLREKFDKIDSQSTAKKERKFSPCSDDNEALRLAKEMTARAL